MESPVIAALVVFATADPLAIATVSAILGGGLITGLSSLIRAKPGAQLDLMTQAEKLWAQTRDDLVETRHELAETRTELEAARESLDTVEELMRACRRELDECERDRQKLRTEAEQDREEIIFLRKRVSRMESHLGIQP